MKKKIFSLLALLLTAATGAWADSFSTDPYEANATLNNVTVSADMEITINKEVIVTVNNGVNIQNGATLTVNGPGKLVVNGATNSTAVSGSIIVNGATVQATGGQGYQGSNGNNGANGGNYPLDGDGQPGGTGVTGGTGGAAFSGTVTIYKGLIIATGGNGGRGGNGGNGGNGYSAFDKGGNGGNGGNGGQGGVAFSGQLTVYGGNVNAIGGAAGLGGSGGAGGQKGPYGNDGSPGNGGPNGLSGKAFANTSANLEVEEAKMYSNAEHTAVINSVSGQTKVYITAPPAFDYKLTYDKTNAHGSVAFTVETEEEELVAPANSANENHKVTFTATPNNGYVVGNISAKPYTEWQTRRSSIDIASNVEISPVPDTENTWTFTMRKANVRIYPDFLLVATFAVENDKPLVPAAVEGVITGEDKAIITAGTVNNIPETTTPQGTVKYFATLDGTMTAEQALAANGWVSTLPTAAPYTNDVGEDFKVYVWYYIQAAEGCADSKPECIEVTVRKNLFTVALNAANANTIEGENGKGTVTVKTGDAEAVDKTADIDENHQLKAVKMGSTVTITTKEGYKFRKVEVKKGGKPVATLTAAPTPGDDLYVGDNLLETLGTAEGGTLMYKVTKTNEKPTSTEGFSTDNPTGVENGPSYKNYIWYYIKGDDSHSDSEISGPIEVSVWVS